MGAGPAWLLCAVLRLHLIRCTCLAVISCVHFISKNEPSAMPSHARPYHVVRLCPMARAMATIIVALHPQASCIVGANSSAACTM